MTDQDDHQGEIVSDWLEGGYGAECSCGWKWHRTSLKPIYAMGALDDHYAGAGSGIQPEDEA
jgi:hypothetical protein